MNSIRFSERIVVDDLIEPHNVFVETCLNGNVCNRQANMVKFKVGHDRDALVQGVWCKC